MMLLQSLDDGPEQMPGKHARQLGCVHLIWVAQHPAERLHLAEQDLQASTSRRAGSMVQREREKQANIMGLPTFELDDLVPVQVPLVWQMAKTKWLSFGTNVVHLAALQSQEHLVNYGKS
eukprot:1154291-Pelagomonas_calceolata.AAC.4